MPTDPATVPPSGGRGDVSPADIGLLYIFSRLTRQLTDDDRREARECAERLAALNHALAASRVDTAEVERRAKYDALTKLADEWNNAAFGVSGPHLTLNATLHASARMVLEFRDRECPAPAPAVSAELVAMVAAFACRGHTEDGEQFPCDLCIRGARNHVTAALHAERVT